MRKTGNNPGPFDKKMPAAPFGEKTTAIPVRRRLLVPLAIVLLMLTAGFGTITIAIQRKCMNHSVREKLTAVSRRFEDSLAEQSNFLAVLADVISRDTVLNDALKALNRERLLADYETVFTQLRSKFGISHFCFHRPDQVNLLRLHKPEKYGDRINRFTVLEAGRIGKTASGVELGPPGTFTLRVVRPVFNSGSLIGYLGLGKEIEDILLDLHHSYGVELAVSIRKNALKRENWETEMKMLGREANWSRFSEDVLAYSSLSGFPSEYKRLIHGEKDHAHGVIPGQVVFNGKSQRVMVKPLTDVSGTEVGDLIIFLDISEDNAVFKQLVAGALFAALALLAALFGFFHAMLQRTDRSIRLQQSNLAESEERFRKIYQNVSVGLARVSMDFRIVQANTAYHQMLGYQEDELTGKHLAEITGAEMLDENLCKQEKLATGEIEHYRMEKRFIHKSGAFVYGILDANLIRDADGNPAYFLGSVLDITERKRAEELLRESEERYKNFFDNTLVGLFRIRISDDTFIEMNTKAAEQLDLPLEKIIGKVRALDLYRNSGQWKELALKLRKYGEAHGFEADLLLHNGREVTFSISVKSFPDKDYLEGIAIDITKRKRIEKEKAQIEDQYRQAQKVEAIGRLAGGVAHDLNNLLVPILGYGEMLMEDFDAKDARRESVSQIVSAGFKARDLVRQLLAFGRKQSLEYNTLDLNKVIRDFKKLLRRTIREDITIEIIASPGLRSIRADIGHIEQVIMNLAVNAQDAMPEGGCLTLETAMAELDEEYAASRPGVQPGLYVMLSVSDTGCGMDEETSAQIFEPFFSTKGEHGTGMGLATIYGIVKQHGGNIWVYSEPGKGATFKIYLPVSEDAHVKNRDVEKIAGYSQGSETILLVEDNEQVRKLSYAILKRRGYTVLSAENGAEALSILASPPGPVHLLLTDVIMPKMNGRELFTKASAKHPHLKALYMSGYTGKVITNHGVMEEGLNFIQKPFSSKALAAKIREVLDND